ncbi:MAG: hypothetical protein RL095_242 [Verrucomicrobiota bacterium]|jgi:hypothetical protein
MPHDSQTSQTDYFLADDNRLRLPGEGIEEMISKHEAELAGIAESRLDLFADAGLGMSLVILGGGLVFHECLRSIFKVPTLLFYAMCLAYILLGGYFIRKTLRKGKAKKADVETLKTKLHQLRNAREGEIKLGMYLERLRNVDGYVLHDLQTGQGNIDHVLVCPWGVFTLEGKVRERKDGKLDIVFDGEAVTVNGYRDTESVKQALAQAKLVKKVLDNAGFQRHVNPLLVFWGADYIDYSSAKNAPLKTMNRRNLSKFMEERIREYFAWRDGKSSAPQPYLGRGEMQRIAAILRDWSLNGTKVALGLPPV